MAIAGVLSGASAQTASPWTKSDKSRARLVSMGGLQDGRYLAGVEIILNNMALTYWRLPGDAGVPPVFGFGKSANLAQAQVRYPSPSRYMEGGTAAFGYRNRVIFPVEIKPADAGRPVTVSLDLNYAVCENICIPAEAKLGIMLRPDAPRTPEAADIEAFLAKVPKPVAMTIEPKLNLWSVRDAAKPTWRVKLDAQPGPVADLFAEGPEGWYFDTLRSGPQTFDIVLAEKPPKANLPLDGVTLTVTDGDRAFEAVMRLDAPDARP